MTTVDQRTATVVVGQRVHCGLCGGRDGIVIRIHGEQSPGSVQTFGGVMVTGGIAKFDIAFPTYISRMVPECVIRGVQWDIYDSVATPDEITAAIREVEYAEARAETKRKADAERRESERLQHAADNPHLLKAVDKKEWSGSRVAAENIRRELKRRFPGQKFSVKSDRNSVNVKWEDGPTDAEVKAVTDRHCDSTRDIYNEDCTVHDHDATFADVFGGAKYVFCDRHMSEPARLTVANSLGYSEIPAEWKYQEPFFFRDKQATTSFYAKKS